MRPLLMAASVLGLFDSVYLHWMYVVGSGPFALPNGCLVLFFSSSPGLASEEHLLLVSGAGLYGSLILLLLVEEIISKQMARWAILAQGLVASVGAAAEFSLNWMSLQILHTLCVWFITSAAIITTFCCLSLYKLLARTGRDAIAQKPSLRSTWGLAVLSTALIGGSAGAVYLPMDAETHLKNINLLERVSAPILRSWSHREGQDNAPVQLVEFSDLECPVCAREAPIIQEVLQHYGRQISYVYRSFPLATIHPNAEEAAEAAECLAAQNRFWPAIETFSRNHDDLAEPMLMHFAQDLGANPDQFRSCLSHHKMFSRVLTDFQDGQRSGVKATPTLFVNGQKVEGYVSYLKLVSLIDGQLSSSTR